MTSLGTNEMIKINYDIKTTSANTEYVTLSGADMATVQINILGILAYMTEMSISKDKEVRDFNKWFTTPDKRYHYNNRLKRYNSPQSYLAGTINNLQFSDQRDFSVTQLQTLQLIMNSCVDVIEALSLEKGIDLQTNIMFTKIWVQENIWTAV